MNAEIQKQLSEHVRGIRCHECGSAMNFEVVVFPVEIAKTRVVGVAKATHCSKRYTVRARREVGPATTP